MQISVPVTFDSTNQTMSVSDSSLITFPQNTSDFSIVDANGTACLTPTVTTHDPNHYTALGISDVIEEVEFDSYIDISSVPNAFHLWFDLYIIGYAYQYSLTYNNGSGYWENPDRASANLPTQQWYTVKIINNDSIKIFDKSTGTLVHSHSFSGKLNYIKFARFESNTYIYLTNLVLKRTINTGIIRYANIAGIVEIWTNIKNWVLAHIGNGTLYIRMGGVEYQFKANQGTDIVIDIPLGNTGYGLGAYGLTPYGGEMEESEVVETYNGVDEIGNALIVENTSIANASNVIEEDADTGADIGTATTTESANTFDEV